MIKLKNIISEKNVTPEELYGQIDALEKEWERLDSMGNQTEKQNQIANQIKKLSHQRQKWNDIRQSINELHIKDKYLYHGTFKPLLNSIKQKGIIPGGVDHKNYDWAGNYVYLADDDSQALSFVECTENDNIPEDWYDQIIVLTIDVSKLDLRKLYWDRNWNPVECFVKSYQYDGIIPPEAIVDFSKNITESMFPKNFDRHNLGTCMGACALATDYLLSKGIKNFKIIEGWVSFDGDWEWDNIKKEPIGNIASHTWIEFSNNRKFDPTKTQWRHWGYEPNEVEYINKIHKSYTPQQYQKICKKQPENLNETLSYNQLMKYVDDGRKERSDHVRERSLPVSVDENEESWNFRYKSNPSVTDQPFQGQITFFKEVSSKDNVADLPCKVDCGCPDFKFRWAYNDTEKDASQIGSDSLNKCINRKPQPAYNQGVGMCKHLVSLSEYLKTKIRNTGKSNLFEAMSDFTSKNKNFIIAY